MRRPKSLIASRDKSQKLGLFERKQLIGKGRRAGARAKSRDSHAIPRDKRKALVAEARQVPEF